MALKNVNPMKRPAAMFRNILLITYVGLRQYAVNNLSVSVTNWYGHVVA